jgi:uncharacterized protein
MNLLKEHIGDLQSLCAKYHVDELYAFGSILKDTFNEKSDIDFLVRFGDVSLVDYFDNYMDFKESLEHLFRKNVDLVEIQTLKNPVLKRSINNNKLLVYGRADTEVVI